MALRHSETIETHAKLESILQLPDVVFDRLSLQHIERKTHLNIHSCMRILPPGHPCILLPSFSD